MRNFDVDGNQIPNKSVNNLPIVSLWVLPIKIAACTLQAVTADAGDWGGPPTAEVVIGCGIIF